MTDKLITLKHYQQEGEKFVEALGGTWGKHVNRSTLRLFIDQDYAGVCVVTNDNYDGAPDAGRQQEGQGSSPLEALIDYFMCNEPQANIDYIIRGEDLK